MIGIPNLDCNEESFRARFKECKFEWQTDNKRLNGSFFYLPFRDNIPTTDDFVNYLYLQIIIYAIPYSERRKAKQDNNPSDFAAYEKIRRDMQQLFKNIDSTNGDVGEFIIYLILRDFFNAPQLVNKFSLKTSGDVSYHKTDGIHIAHDGSDLLIYFAESKLRDTKNPTEAIKSAIKSSSDNFGSINGRKTTNKDFEISLISRHFSLPILEENSGLKEKVLNFFNPLKCESNNAKYILPCFVGYSSDYRCDNQSSNHEDFFLKNYQEVISKSTKLFNDTITNDQKLQDYNFVFILMPFESVADLCKKLHNKIFT